MNDLFRGIGDVAEAFRFLLARPSLWRYVVAPFLIAVVLAALILWWIASSIDPMVASATDWLPSFLESIAGKMLRGLLWLAFMVLGYVFYLALAAVLTTPFCELLSEAVEEELTGQEAPAFSWSVLFRDMLLGVVHALRRVFLFLASVLALLLLGAFIPVFGTIAALVLGGFVTSRFAAYDCFDTVWARKGWSYQSKMDYLQQNRNRSLGVGAGVAGLALIPFLSALALPLGSIAATRISINEEGQV